MVMSDDDDGDDVDDDGDDDKNYDEDENATCPLTGGLSSAWPPALEPQSSLCELPGSLIIIWLPSSKSSLPAKLFSRHPDHHYHHLVSFHITLHLPRYAVPLPGKERLFVHKAVPLDINISKFDVIFFSRNFLLWWRRLRAWE